MNTSLLNTNTTNNTTKNLKIMAAVICMIAVFVFTNTEVFAQAISNSEGTSPNVRKEVVVQKLPITNSKSIEEHTADKAAWLKDHPHGIETAAPVEKTKSETVLTEKSIAPAKLDAKVYSPEVVKKETPAPVHIVTEYKGTPQRLNNADIKVTPVTE